MPTLARAPLVLMVDDEPQVRDLAGRALTGQGFRCDTAGDGAEALRLVEQTRYSAIVTDLRMPVRHGFALCDDVLGMRDPPPIMVCTALCDSRLVRDLMSRGVHEVVNKPVNYDVLAMKVRSMIDHHSSNRLRVGAPQTGRRVISKSNLLMQIETALVEMTSLMGERLDLVFDADGELPEPPRAVRDFIRRLAENESADSESLGGVALQSDLRREKARVTCYATAIGTPVDRSGVRVGAPFKLALRDLSESGVRLLHTRSTNAHYLALCWNASLLRGRQIRVVCQVRRCEPCGPFYDIGGQFVMAD